MVETLADRRIDGAGTLRSAQRSEGGDDPDPLGPRAGDDDLDGEEEEGKGELESKGLLFCSTFLGRLLFRLEEESV